MPVWSHHSVFIPTILERTEVRPRQERRRERRTVLMVSARLTAAILCTIYPRGGGGITVSSSSSSPVSSSSLPGGQRSSDVPLRVKKNYPSCRDSIKQCWSAPSIKKNLGFFLPKQAIGQILQYLLEKRFKKIKFEV